jgi:hypothetical protein
LIQTETEFEAKFTSGSNPQMELLFEGTDSIVEKGIGMIRQMTFDYVSVHRVDDLSCLIV